MKAEIPPQWPPNLIHTVLGIAELHDHAAALLGYATMARQIGPHFAALENLDALATSGTLGILALLMRAPPAQGEQQW